ncbi:hypothetical protein CUMW_266580 [Citrus unshiu]|uniref:Uncharacterized protein n=2 Tax=Citrus TaxID=2706 RepID=A0A067DJX1_CITSI|nr:hypothetical protein CISIN_1g036960mg [Citrus sinensis]GAY68748.1 hypothetical protein CUMW_266580 [Citrus unshiu]
MEILQDIGCLSLLKELNLCVNDFQRLPASIGSLSSLKRMNLVENKLDNLPITISIKQISPLRTLELRNCNTLQSLPKLLLPSYPEKVDTFMLESLSKLFRIITTRKLTYFIFTKCLKLNKSGNILADSQQKIQHMFSLYYPYFVSKMVANVGCKCRQFGAAKVENQMRHRIWCCKS